MEHDGLFLSFGMGNGKRQRCPLAGCSRGIPRPSPSPPPGVPMRFENGDIATRIWSRWMNYANEVSGKLGKQGATGWRLRAIMQISYWQIR